MTTPRARNTLLAIALLAAASVGSGRPALAQRTGGDLALARWCCATCHSTGESISEKTRVAEPGPAPAPTPPTRPGRVDPRAVPPDVLAAAAAGTDGARYSGLVATVYLPDDDAAADTIVREDGWRKAGEFRTWGPMPAGWWVYAKPYWVVWERKNGELGE